MRHLRICEYLYASIDCNYGNTYKIKLIKNSECYGKVKAGFSYKLYFVLF